MELSIEIEYKQWLFMYDEMFKEEGLIKTLFNFTDKNSVKEDIKECKKTILHWLVYVNQDRSIVKYEHFPLLPKIVSIDEPIPDVALKLVKWIKEKELFSKNKKELFDKEYNEKESRLAVKRLLKHIQKRHNELQLEKLPLPKLRESGEITFENFKSRDYTQLSYLLDNQRGTNPGKLSEGKWSLKDITKMIMRYESFNDNNLFQGSFHNDLYMRLYDDFGVRFEGFASPLNAHLLGMSDCRFCSLFLDTDDVFGSMGDFFDIEFSEYPGAWLINPPFVEDILDKVAKKVIDSGVRGTYFCVYPSWKNNDGWKKLQNSDYKIKACTKSVQYLYDEFGKKFLHNKKMSFFCLSSDKRLKENKNFENLWTTLMSKIETA